MSEKVIHRFENDHVNDVARWLAEPEDRDQATA
jgi:hypothetical protein